MEFNRFLRISGEENRRIQEETCASTGNSRASVSEEMDFVQMYLTCLPEPYMKAKFTLTAYLACWLILKLCKVRTVHKSAALIVNFRNADQAEEIPADTVLKVYVL